MCPSDEIQIFLPVNELALADSRFTKSNDDTVKVLADSGMEIEFAPELVLADGNDVFVSDFFLLKQAITFIYFSVRTY